MLHRSVVPYAVALFASATLLDAQGQPRVIALTNLTLPAARQGGPCALSSSPTIATPSSPGDRTLHVRGGLWASLPITSNPWSGTDPHALAEIRGRIDPRPPLRDAPRSAAEAASLKLALADGVDAGYAAVYLEEGTNAMVVVYALKFAGGRIPATIDQPASTAAATRFVFGPTVVVVSSNGTRGPCFQQVEAHVQSLAR